MKKMKKIMSLVLVAAMSMAVLSGCGGQKAASNTFKIGGIGPTTGGAAVYGTNVMNAAQIAIDEINAAGGINGYQVEYNFQDDELDSEKSVNAYNTLKDWGMQILMGSVTSGCSIAVSAKSSEDNMFQITPSGSSADCVLTDNAFQVCFTDPNQGIASADYIADHALASKIGIIYDSSDVYSTGIYTKFVEEAAVKGLDIVSAEAFTADNKTDFSVQLQKAQDAGADLVFLPFYYTEISLVLTQANTMGYQPIFFGVDGMDGILDVENFDKALAEGCYLLTPYSADATDDLTVNFVKQYRAKYNNETPNQFAADAYDAIYIIKACIEEKKLTPADDVSTICNAMKEAITSLSYDGVTGTGMTWAATGEVSKAPKAVMIVNGAYQLQ